MSLTYMALHENHVKPLNTKTTVIASIVSVNGASMHHFSGMLLAGEVLQGYVALTDLRMESIADMAFFKVLTTLLIDPR